MASRAAVAWAWIEGESSGHNDEKKAEESGEEQEKPSGDGKEEEDEKTEVRSGEGAGVNDENKRQKNLVKSKKNLLVMIKIPKKIS
jgi:TATA-binding protein-associated factor Taf7